MRYAKFIILLRIPGSNVNINFKKSGKKRDVGLAFGFLNKNSS